MTLSAKWNACRMDSPTLRILGSASQEASHNLLDVSISTTTQVNTGNCSPPSSPPTQIGHRMREHARTLAKANAGAWGFDHEHMHACRIRRGRKLLGELGIGGRAPRHWVGDSKLGGQRSGRGCSSGMGMCSERLVHPIYYGGPRSYMVVRRGTSDRLVPNLLSSTLLRTQIPMSPHPSF